MTVNTSLGAGMINDRAVLRYYYFLFPAYETHDLHKRAVYEQLQEAYADHLSEVGRESERVSFDGFIASQRQASVSETVRIELPIEKCSFGEVAVTFEAFSVYEGAFLLVKWEVKGDRQILPDLYSAAATNSPQQTMNWRSRTASVADGTVNYLGCAWVYYGESPGLKPGDLAQEWVNHFPDAVGKEALDSVAVGDGGNLSLWKRGQSLDLMFSQDPATVSAPVNSVFWNRCLPGLLLGRLKSDFFFLCIQDAMRSLSIAAVDMERLARELRPETKNNVPRGLDILRSDDEKLTDGAALIQRKLQQIEADTANLRAQDANVVKLLKGVVAQSDARRCSRFFFTGSHLSRLKLHRASLAHAKGYLAWIKIELERIRSTVDHIDKSWNLVFTRTSYVMVTIQAIGSFVAVANPLWFSATMSNFEKWWTLIAATLIASVSFAVWRRIRNQIVKGSALGKAEKVTSI